MIPLNYCLNVEYFLYENPIVFTPKVKRKYNRDGSQCVYAYHENHHIGETIGGYWFLGMLNLPCSKCNPQAYEKAIRGLRWY